MTENRKLWDAWSDSFQAAWNAETAEGDAPPVPVHYGPGFPEEDRLDLVPEYEDGAVVELGCGGGQAAIGFALEGANSVVGVDFSASQLAHARQHRDAYGADVRFLAGDVSQLPLADDAFDLAFSSWVFQMVPDFQACAREAARILRPGGAFVFALPHPFYEMFDPGEQTLERSYFADDPEQKTIGDLEPEMTVYHHTVGDIHRALVESEFVVERLLEPGSDDPSDYEAQWSHKPDLMAQVPPTLVFRGILDGGT